MNNPLISIIIPAYNCENYISQCLKSVSSQTYTNLEILVCDDASTDNTYSVLNEYFDPRLKILKNDSNLGISATQNKLLSIAKGDFIAIMNSDDVMYNDRISTQLNFLQNNLDVDIVGAEIDIQYANTGLLTNNHFKKLLINHDDIKKQLLHSTAIDHITLFARKKVFDKIRYNEFLPAAVDLDIELQALSAGLKFANIPNVVCKYLIHDNSTGTKRRDKQLRGAFYAHKLYHERLIHGREITDLSKVDFSKPRSVMERLFLDFSVIKREDNTFTKIIRFSVSPFSSLGRYCLKRKILKFLSE